MAPGGREGMLPAMFGLLLLTSLLPAQAATPLAGVAWTPLSRADLVWVGDDRTSGVAVGEFDGVVAPNLSAFGGVWLSDSVGLIGSLGLARLTSTTWVGDTWRQRHWGVLRPGIDLRYSLGPREVRRPAAWILGGIHGDIPSARDTSNAYSPEEQAIADEDAALERARLGGFGARVGLGVDYRLAEGIAVGAQWSMRWHQSVLRTDQAMNVSSWVAADVALLLTFEWPSE